MRNFVSNNRLRALMAILVLGIGSISVVATTHVATASQIGKLCVFFACGNANITGGTSSSGGGGGGQPTPTTGTLTVTKEVHCAPGTFCPDVSTFKIKVVGNNPSPANFDASTTGTQVTLGPGQYSISDQSSVGGFKASFTGNCVQSDPDIPTATGNMNAGDKQTCSILNDNGVQ